MPDLAPINHRDPNVLVWVAAKKIGGQTLSNDPAWARHISNTATNAIGDSEHVRDTLNYVLEATASLAISNPKLQVVAVALNVGNAWTGAHPRLTMAENGLLKAGLAAHMTDVWRILQQISHQEAVIDDLHRRDPDDNTIPGLKTANRAAGNELARLVYLYSAQKNLGRYNKWIPRLVLFSLILDELDGHHEPLTHFRDDLNSFHLMHTWLRNPDEELLPAREGIVTTIEQLHARKTEEARAEWAREDGWSRNSEWARNIALAEKTKGSRESEWATLVKEAGKGNWKPTFDDLMDWDPATPDGWLDQFPEDIQDAVKTVDDRRVFVKELQEWATQLRKDDDFISIIRALSTLTSQERHIRTLIDAAKDPQLRPLFFLAMEVEPVPPTPNIEVAVPLTPDVPVHNVSPLASIIGAMYESIKPAVATQLIESEVVKLRASLSQNNQGKNTGVVHCECGLVAYLYQQSALKLTTQFNYIGVSKLSCGACHAWLLAFNATRGQEMTYHTGGTHGKWYTNWAIPPSLATTELKDHFSRLVCEQFVRYCDPNINERALADKTGSSNPNR